MVTNSRKMFRSPIFSKVYLSPLNFRSCGWRPDRRERKDLCPVANLRESVDDGPIAPDAEAAPSFYVLADDRVGANDRAPADLGAFHDDRRRVMRTPSGNDGERRSVLAQSGRRERHGRPRQRRAAPAERHLEATADRPARPAVETSHHRRRAGNAPTSASALRARARAPPPPASAVLDHEHAGLSAAWKMPLKEVFVDGDVLMGDDRRPRIVLGHRTSTSTDGWR